MPDEIDQEGPATVGIGERCPDCGYLAKLPGGRCVRCAAEAKLRERKGKQKVTSCDFRLPIDKPGANCR